MPRTYDQEGNQLHDWSLGGMGAEYSFGASLWEFMNPAKVQLEDEAIGARARTYTDIWGDATHGMLTAAEESRQEIVAESKATLNQIGPLLMVGVVAVAVIAIMTRK